MEVDKLLNLKRSREVKKEQGFKSEVDYEGYRKNLTKREWAPTAAARFTAKKAAYSSKEIAKKKAMGEDLKELMKIRQEIMMARPIRAYKTTTEAMVDFKKFVDSFAPQEQALFNYDKTSFEDYKLTKSQGGHWKPYFVDNLGHLKGGLTVGMLDNGSMGTLPLKTKDEGRLLLSAVGKYWNPSLFPSVRLIKFIRTTPVRVDGKSRGKPKSVDSRRVQIY